jgi:hypothetical protein
LGGEAMEGELRVEVDLLAEDAEAMRQALTAAGRHPEADLPWLLEYGLSQYASDEASWQHLEDEGAPDDDVRRRELKRRETEALLVSMRANTIAAEKVMHDLGETVRALGAQLHANRQEMWPMRQEAAALEARLRELTTAGNGSAPGAGDRQGMRVWLRRMLRGNHDAHE